MEVVIEAFDKHPIWLGLLGGLFIAALNMGGALVLLFWPRPSPCFLDAALGFAVGVMLTASFTSLILPGIERGGLLPVLVGLALGALMMEAGDRWLPHKHFLKGHEGPEAQRIRRVWLFIIAITLHNMPEGLAVGVSFGSGYYSEAIQLMLAIGIQNIPEGLSVAVSSLSAGLGARFYASMVGVRSGMVEIPAAVLGAALVHYMAVLLPWAMGFAAGAMLYVISHEILPETHRMGHERLATLGTMLGIIVMLTLDVALS